ncbi:hypothetical protein FVEG_08192 [Fusarium verticillioides 7600]|uniref:Uncharacterized protein n=1 Tax=Gibberella moniliformis (strain M3125 / FGSC 7600) TaxID=334819 RepID=W7M9Z5_GIBM7|nr:hypothetical protein FVEG_08192 [Fusarium verticillioides 7600]EWG48408.1 hypothetical protein FVEG_08192 [Fusarium verticillioides 7600]
MSTRGRTNVDIQFIGVNYLFLENVRADRDTQRSILWRVFANDAIHYRTSERSLPVSTDTDVGFNRVPLLLILIWNDVSSESLFSSPFRVHSSNPAEEEGRRGR